MWFDAQAALEHLDGAEQPRSNPEPPEKPKPPSLAGLASLAGDAAANPMLAASREKAETAFPYGESVRGRPLTYTGRVVSLDAWRSLTEWEKHGPRGRVWNARTKKWE